jgi:hypothetical protein
MIASSGERRRVRGHNEARHVRASETAGPTASANEAWRLVGRAQEEPLASLLAVVAIGRLTDSISSPVDRTGLLYPQSVGVE